MKYIVISCIERELESEAVCDTYAEAYTIMKNHFLEFHREHLNDRELEELKLEIEAGTDVENCDYGFHSGCCGFAWGNVDDNYKYDIKIFKVE